MVKIWGYRVELGEIESCLLEMNGIEQAAVVKVSADAEFGDTLQAFAVATSGVDIDPRTVLQHCKTGLPAYMVPQSVRFLDSLPLSQNGKIDRRELQALAAPGSS